VIRVANAPVSYGAFELTVGISPYVPAADDVLAAIAEAGYEGTELGPLGYLGTGETLRRRLASHGLDLAGAFVELRFGDGDVAALEATLDALEGFAAQPILCDEGPRDGEIDLDGVSAALELARARGFEPAFHHHMGTRVQTPAEIERLLSGTDVALLLDTGHLAAAGGDPVQALRDWRDRVRHVHLKDVLRTGAFCELGAGDVDLEAFCADLRRGSYDGWLVVEHDRIPASKADADEAAAAQARNRRWLRAHAGL
jgi:inosose dehydratase